MLEHICSFVFFWWLKLVLSFKSQLLLWKLFQFSGKSTKRRTPSKSQWEMLLYSMENKRCKNRSKWCENASNLNSKSLTFCTRPKSQNLSLSLSFALWIPTQLWSRRHSEFVSRLRAPPTPPSSSSYNSDKNSRKEKFVIFYCGKRWIGGGGKIRLNYNIGVWSFETIFRNIPFKCFTVLWAH